MNIHLPAILMFTRGTWFWHTAIWVFSMGYTPQMGKLKLTRLEWGGTPFFGFQLSYGSARFWWTEERTLTSWRCLSHLGGLPAPLLNGKVGYHASKALHETSVSRDAETLWNPWFPSIFECGWLPEIGHPRIQSFFGSSPPFSRSWWKNMSKSHRFIQSKPGDTMEIQWIAQIWQCVKTLYPWWTSK